MGPHSLRHACATRLVAEGLSHERNRGSSWTPQSRYDSGLRQSEPCRASSSGRLRFGRSGMKLKDLITQYVAFRKSMGGDFESADSLLKTFCRRVGVDIDIADIRTERVEEFLTATGVNHYWRRKYDTLRGFYRYATSRGFVNQAPLPATVPKMPERFVPYIYNADELQRLINPTAPHRIGFLHRE